MRPLAVTLDLDALPSQIAESLRAVLDAHGLVLVRRVDLERADDLLLTAESAGEAHARAEGSEAHIAHYMRGWLGSRCESARCRLDAARGVNVEHVLREAGKNAAQIVALADESEAA